MRNLKKILALVLVLVMAMSFASAAYADADSINYVEAVNVMSGVGIFNGIDGEFQPQGNLTREQAMKIVAYMLLGQEKADALPKDIQPFADVEEGRWSAGAIAYCASKGIVSGDGTGNFNPTANVTGYEFGKMVMGAAGITGEFTGDNWKFNVALALTEEELLDNLDTLILSESMTREQACQLAFNGLLKTSVARENGCYAINYTGEDTVLAAVLKVKQYDDYLDAVIAANTLGLAKTEYTIVPAKTVVNDKHDFCDFTATNDFGVVTTGWCSEDGKTVYHAVEEEAIYTVSNKTISANELHALLGVKAGETVTVAVYTNSKTATGSIVASDAKTAKATVGGNGIVTSVYYDGVNAPKVVEVVTTLTTVTEFHKAEAPSAENPKGVPAYVDLANGLTIETETYEKDDVLLVTVAEGKVQSHTFAELAVDTLYEVNTKKGTITLKESGSYVVIGDIADYADYDNAHTYYTDGVNVYGYGPVVEDKTPDVEIDGYAQLLKVKLVHTGDSVETDEFGTTGTPEAAEAQAYVRHLNGKTEVVDVYVEYFDGKTKNAAGETPAKGFYWNNPITGESEKIVENITNTYGDWVSYYLEDGAYDFTAVQGATVMTGSIAKKGTVKLGDLLLTSKTVYTEYNDGKTATYETTLTGYKNIVTAGEAYMLVFTAPKSNQVTEIYAIVNVDDSTDTSVKLDDYAYAMAATGAANKTTVQWSFVINGEPVNYYVANDEVAKLTFGAVCVLTIDKGVVTDVVVEKVIDMEAAEVVEYVDEAYFSTDADIYTFAKEYAVFNAETGAVDTIEKGDKVVVAKTNDKDEVVLIFVEKAEA